MTNCLKFTTEASIAIDQNDHERAIRIYQQGIVARPELAWLYRQNIIRLKKRPGLKALPIVVGICSIPDRIDSLKLSLTSLLPQVNKIYLYLDRYEKVPEFVQEHADKIRAVLSSDFPGLRDNGKFLTFAELEGECYYFTADDDIIYPACYVESMIGKIEFYDRRAVVGVHGIILPVDPERYFSPQRCVLQFSKALSVDRAVNVLGTGTVAFHSATLKGMSLCDFLLPGMSDVFLALYCRRQHIPMIAISREESWLREQSTKNDSLFSEFNQMDLDQSTQIQFGSPWGSTAVNNALRHAADKVSCTHARNRFNGLLVN